jgi:ferrous iron transport protein A
MTYLDKLVPGQIGRVVGFIGDSPIVRRLAELGVVPGRRIRYLRNAPLQDPMEIEIGTSCLSLRHSEASLVLIELEES